MENICNEISSSKSLLQVIFKSLTEKDLKFLKIGTKRKTSMR